MKKFGVSLAGAGVAAVFILAAQSAHAGTALCPGDNSGEGGGVHDNQVPGDNCPQPGDGYSSLELTTYTADNVAVDVVTVVEAGDEILAPGTIIEVEIDLDDVMAYLKQNEDKALVLAAASGIRPTGIIKTARPMAAKLSSAEVKVVAVSLLSSMQGSTARGRSDPAGQNTSRREATGIAYIRAIGSAIRSAFSANARASRTVEIRPDGTRIYRTEVQVEVNPDN